LIGPIALGDTTGIDWLVTGGESGSDRRMEKSWAVSLRDQCETGGVPFFFKQWGAFNEEGVKAKKQKKDGLTPPTLDGVVHNEYPA
jgi:protein gp37